VAQITRSSFLAGYGQHFSTVTSSLVDYAVAYANALGLSGYSDDTQNTYRRDVEVAAILFAHPKGRSLLKNWPIATGNPFRDEADRLDKLKGAANRVPGWELPAGVT